MPGVRCRAGEASAGVTPFADRAKFWHGRWHGLRENRPTWYTTRSPWATVPIGRYETETAENSSLRECRSRMLARNFEPGFYVEGRWGARIEDIVVATEDGPRSLNSADHRLAIVEA